VADGKISPIKARNVNSEILRDRLKRLGVGDKITYEELSKLIASNVQHGRARGWLNSARRAVYTETCAIFGVITNVGLQRLNDAQALEAQRGALDSVRRRSKRIYRVLTNLKPENLTSEQRSQLYARVTIAAIAAMSTESRVETKILPMAAKNNAALPTAALLDQMRNL